MKKKYMKPEQRIIVLQHQSHLLLAGSGEKVQSLRGGYFYYGGDDEDYDEGAR